MPSLMPHGFDPSIQVDQPMQLDPHAHDLSLHHLQQQQLEISEHQPRSDHYNNLSLVTNPAYVVESQESLHHRYTNHTPPQDPFPSINPYAPPAPDLVVEALQHAHFDTLRNAGLGVEHYKILEEGSESLMLDVDSRLADFALSSGLQSRNSDYP
jgi:hypothetical protein